ncbi:MAG TPA: hypothetical protein VF350_08450 [Candidatus Bathyarchaeia archaeon]
MPLFFAKKEVFQWLGEGQKTIDIRKGNPKPGEIAVFQSGSRILRLKIVKTESGQLKDILRLDNFKEVIPSAAVLGDAFGYLQGIYGVNDGVFTAYYVGSLLFSEK